jgi:hypothetical protein
MIQASILALLVNTAPSASVVQQLLQIAINANKMEEVFKVNIKENHPVNIVMNDYYNQSIVLNRNGQPVNVLQKNMGSEDTHNFLNVEKIKVSHQEASVLMTYGTLKITVKMKKYGSDEWIFVSSYIKNKGKRNWDFEF